MNLPKVTNDTLSTFFDKEEIVRETVAQIQKDLGGFGIDITFSGKMGNVYTELHEQLVTQIEIMSKHSYSKLISILYRIDISEKEIANATAEMPQYNQIEVVAHQIIVRELKKVLTRRYYT